MYSINDNMITFRDDYNQENFVQIIKRHNKKNQTIFKKIFQCCNKNENENEIEIKIEI